MRSVRATVSTWLRGWRQRARRWHDSRVVRGRARALTRLVHERLPADHEATGDSDAWPLVGAGLVSRATTAIEAIMRLHGPAYDIEAGTLVRSLYEYVVHLAWLGADPSAARMEAWRKDDLRKRLVADDDARQRGEPLFTAEQRAVVQAQVGAMTGDRLVLERLAHDADDHWAGLLPGMGTQREPSSFRGLYPFLYRQYSATAHPTYRGLNSVVETLAPNRQRVHLEPFDVRPPYGLATVVYGLGLLVAAASLGWPDRDRVITAFERWPSGQGDWDGTTSA